MVHFLNCMMFCVRVPVLSEKMYWIWPSCSLRVVVRACQALRKAFCEHRHKTESTTANMFRQQQKCLAWGLWLTYNTWTMTYQKNNEGRIYSSWKHLTPNLKQVNFIFFEPRTFTFYSLVMVTQPARLQLIPAGEKENGVACCRCWLACCKDSKQQQFWKTSQNRTGDLTKIKIKLKKKASFQICCTLAGVSFSAKYICRSQLMNLLWPRRMTSTLHKYKMTEKLIWKRPACLELLFDYSLWRW